LAQEVEAFAKAGFKTMTQSQILTFISQHVPALSRKNLFAD
jgi:hypothetical protein